MGAAKDVVTVKAEAAPMAPPLIRYVPRAEAVARSAWRPYAAVDVAIIGRSAVARGAAAPMALLLRSREARVDRVGIV